MPHNQIIDLDPDEQLILVVRRSKIGLIPIIASGLLVLVGVLLAVYLIARFPATVARTIPVPTALAVVIGIAALIVLMLVITVLVYLGNEMLVTSERIVSVIRSSLFNREVSQLNLDDIQEVAAKQGNIFESLFNFGTVLVETAANLNNFSFRFAKDPYHVAKVIDDTQEKFGGAPPAPTP